TPELAQITAAVKAEEDRRLAALDKQAAEAGDTRWVLDLHSTGKDQSIANDHWSSGFILPPSTLEEQQLHFGNAGDDEDEDDEEAGGAMPGRRTFGVSKKKNQRFQKDFAGQSGDVDGDEEVQALINSERNRQQHGGKGFKNKKKRDSSGSMKYDFGDEDEEEEDEEESDTKDDDYGDRSLRDLTSISGGKIASISARGGGGKRYSDASSEQKSASLRQGDKRPAPKTASSGPEPSYTTGHHETFKCKQPLLLDWGGVLPNFNIAYETWGELNADKSNAILLHTGLSASSHAHSTPTNTQPGWWEKFIGPGAPIDTDKFFVICTNVIGSCFGSTGPSSIDPSDGQRYATRFPILTLEDMIRSQFRLVDAFGITKLAASVGSSMGGMQSLAAGVLFPDRVGKIISISGCARTHPYSIAMRHTQRQAVVMDPNWARGFYYDSVPPHTGMKLAREIATVTYRSGPEWEKRFGRRRADATKQPALCPDFLIETYLDHAGEKWSLTYDPNSFLYVSKAMDLFDLSASKQDEARERRKIFEEKVGQVVEEARDLSCSLTLPAQPYEEQALEPANERADEPGSPSKPPKDLINGLSALKNHPVLVMGVASDNLFPAWQQREIAEALKQADNRNVKHIELGEDVSLFGHDTFLLDVQNIGGRQEEVEARLSGSDVTAPRTARTSAAGATSINVNLNLNAHLARLWLRNRKDIQRLKMAIPEQNESQDSSDWEYEYLDNETEVSMPTSTISPSASAELTWE
ncbi:hypothetical protein KEM56_002479, partial [Ascosphaera pollenicola]